MGERKVIVLGHRINQHGVALIEGAALRILSGEADRIAFQNDGTKRQRFRKPVVYGALSAAHFGALLASGRYRLRIPVCSGRADTAPSSPAAFEDAGFFSARGPWSALPRIPCGPLPRVALSRCRCVRRKSSKAADDS